ncbi:MAG TPA: hypothetical protein VLT36_11400 [Candidatus Dormibacteraeota bacterium]|nr:hypothetical protein [Candidatus Dormibacteraeota bacterium]
MRPVSLASLLLLLVMFTVATAAEVRTDATTAGIGQPTIFWRNNGWQVFQDGQWVSYSTMRRTENALIQLSLPEPQEFAIPQPEGDITDTNLYVAPYPYWGAGGLVAGHGHEHFPLDGHRRHRAFNGGRNHGLPPTGRIGQTTIGIGQTTIGIGQTTIGIGQPNAGIGQTTIGIGQRNVSLGQTTIGIGQPTTGIGAPNVVIGQRNGIGQPNASMGQTTIGIGQPTIGIGQTTIGIGRPLSSHESSHHSR